MIVLEKFVEDLLIQGRAYFSREEALAALEVKPETLAAAITKWMPGS